MIRRAAAGASAIAVACALVVGAAGHARAQARRVVDSDAPTASPVATAPSPSGTAPPSTSPLPTASAVPTPPPTPVPTPSPTPLYNYVYRPPAAAATPLPGPGAPQIDEIDLSQIAFVPPSDIHVRVITNATTTAVVATTLGRTIEIPRVANGVFAIDTGIPAIPFWLGYLRNRTYPITFVASVPDGRNTQVVLALTLH